MLAILVAGKIAVLEEVAWFKNLARVTLEGDERALTGMSITGAFLVRKVAENRRVAICISTRLSIGFGFGLLLFLVPIPWESNQTLRMPPIFSASPILHTT